MAYNTSSWNSTVPSGTSSIRDGDDQIRADKATIQSVIADEHYFDTTSASSLSGGVHKVGSARIYGGLRSSMSTPSSADSSNRLYFATDARTLHFWGVSSATTIGESQDVGLAKRQAGGSVTSVWQSIDFLTNLVSIRTVGDISNFTFSSGVVTVPTPGVYGVTGYAVFDLGAVSNNVQLAIVSDAPSDGTVGRCGSTSTGTVSLNVSSYVALSAGSTVKLRTSHDSTNTLTISDARISVHRLSLLT